jgi:biopolymer transport protein ExbD
MPGTMKFHGKRGAAIADINITPLVDVCLVLVIIMMVAATAIVAKTMKVQLPKAHTAEGPAAKPATVTMLKDGSLRWDDHPASEAEIKRELTERAAADPDTSLVLSADKEVMHGKVVHILDVARGAGITKFAINVSGE